MLKMRIIPCLDVREGKVVKGIKFRDHEVMGDIVPLAEQYSALGADELVFYDITASSENRVVDCTWITRIAQRIQIPFCVAGGIRRVEDAERIFDSGADKISINSPALENPDLITALSKRFGRQSIVVGIDSIAVDGQYKACQFTGDPDKTRNSGRNTLDWAREVADRGAGEIVLNSMNQDGVRSGYDIEQLALISDKLDIPVIASGGAGEMSHFKDVFERTRATGALAASVFHRGLIEINALKQYLAANNIQVRQC
ncbi:MAG: imidazole glycerol phosphate synthase subunit HisF [Gammaproteobacteria bacterium]